MKPAPRSDAELLTWAANVVRYAQEQGLFGTVTFRFEKGLIVQAQTLKSEVPPKS
jgi:hypothetical protein